MAETCGYEDAHIRAGARGCSNLLYEVPGSDGHFEPEGEPEVDELGLGTRGGFVAIEGSYIDDVTGKGLDAKMVFEGRREELKGFDGRGVYEVRTREWAETNGIPVLGTRWVDRMKAGRVRSRLCVQDFNFRKGKAGPDDLFAPIPPCVAARYVASRSASGPRFPGGSGASSWRWTSRKRSSTERWSATCALSCRLRTHARRAASA